MTGRRLGPTARANLQAIGLHAATRPFNLVLLLGVAAAGTLLGSALAGAILALVIYVIACTVTAFDEEEQDRVIAARRASAAEIEQPREAPLDPSIARYVTDARIRRDRIAQAAAGEEDGIIGEVDVLVDAVTTLARRASRIHVALTDTPAHDVRGRLQRAVDPELKEVLRAQLAILERMEGQLERFHLDMERTIAELDTIRITLLSASASEQVDMQRTLTADVRGLRESATALADGMRETFELTA